MVPTLRRNTTVLPMATRARLSGSRKAKSSGDLSPRAPVTTTTKASSRSPFPRTREAPGEVGWVTVADFWEVQDAIIMIKIISFLSATSHSV